MNIVTNFRNRKSNPLIDKSDIQIGGNNLLQYFFSRLDPCRSGGVITLITPYISLNDGMLDMMRHLPHSKFEVNVYTDGDSSLSQASKIIEAYDWGAKSLRQIKQLHAKVFLCKTNNDFTRVLISSQNLTQAAMTQNIEAGVYLCCYKDKIFNLSMDRFINWILSHNNKSF